MQLVQDILPQRDPAPAAVIPVEARADDLRRTVDILWLGPGRRIGSFTRTIEPILVQRPGLNPLNDGFIVAAGTSGHRDDALTGSQQMDLNRLRERRPYAESAAPLSQIPSSHGRRKLRCDRCALRDQTHSPCPPLLKNTADKGGRVRFNEYGRPWQGTGAASTPPILP